MSLKKFWLPFVVIAFALFFSCKKNDTVNDGRVLPDLHSKVSTSASGFVTDENNDPVPGASVRMGLSTTATDQFGYFKFENVEVVKTAAVITVTHSGYFKGVRTYIAEAGNPVIVRIKLLPKTSIGTIDAAAGGSATAINGLKVQLPANAVVDGSGAAYTGPVTVSATWLNPESADFDQIMPGDLRALNTSGEMRTLLSYGMAAVELTGNGGQTLKIADEKRSTVSFPLPATLQSLAPASIPLWHFDEEKGLWIEEGSAMKIGDKYVGEVNHFSFWNCDVPANFVQFNATINDANGNPVPYTMVKLTMADAPFTSCVGYTNASGYVSGAIPASTDLIMTVNSNYCGYSLHTHNIAATVSNISLGVVSLATQNMANVSGMISDCNMQPVTNGFLIVKASGINYRYPVDVGGAFSFSFPYCPASPDAVIYAQDVSNNQSSPPVIHSFIQGTNALGNLQACGASISQFIHYTINGIPYSITVPQDTMAMDLSGAPPTLRVLGSNHSGRIIDFKTNVFQGASELLNFYSSDIGFQVTIPTTINVEVTELGNVGEFISGNFSGIVRGSQPNNVDITIECEFRVRWAP